MSHLPVGGTAVATVVALSPDDSPTENWSLKDLQEQDDVKRHPDLARMLSHTLLGMEIRTAYAPNVAAMSANVVESSVLTNRIHLGSADLYRNKSVPADGVFLEPEEGFVMSAVGCPLIIAGANGYLVVAHAGRDSLIDRGAVIGEPTRSRISVVDAIVEAFARRGIPAKTVTMVMMLALPADVFRHPFDHEEYGDYNRALAAFVRRKWPNVVGKKPNLFEHDNAVYLDLEQIFVEQARQAGVCSSWAMNSLEDHTYLSHTHDGKDPRRRNLIVVKRET